MANTIEIIINTLMGKGADGVDDAKESLEDLDNQTKKTSKSTSSLGKAVKVAGGIIAGVAAREVVRMVAELGELGAVSERTEVALANLSGGAEEAEAFITAVGDASNHTISRVDAMQASITAQTLGVVESAEEMGRLTEVAITLGQAQGLTATQAIQDMTTALGRQEPEILDNLGIQMKLTDAYEGYAGTLGKSVEELTETEKQQAFLNEAMARGEEVAADLGGAMDDNLSKIEANRAAMEDLKAELGKRFAGAVAGSNSMLGKFTRSWGDLLREVNSGETSLMLANIRFMTETLDASTFVGDKWGLVLSALTGDLQGVIMASRNLKEAQEEANDETETASFLAQGYTQRLQHYKNAQENTTDTTDASTASLELWNEGAFGAIRATEGLIKTGSELTQEQFELTRWAVSADITDRLEDTRDTLAGLRDRAGELNGKIDDLEGQSYLTSAQQGELDNLYGELDEVDGKIQDTTESLKNMAAQFILGLIEMKISADGEISDIEARMYTAYAEQMGLIDQTAAETSNTIVGILSDLEAGHIREDEAIRAVINTTRDLTEDYDGLGTTGRESLTEIIESGEATVKKMVAIGVSAEEAQRLIDQMHGKDIDVDIHYNEHGRPGVIEAPGGGVIEAPGGDLAEAEGGYVPPGRSAWVGEAGFIESITALSGGGVQVRPTNTPAQGAGATTILAPIFLDPRMYQDGAGEWDFDALNRTLQRRAGVEL